MQAEAENYNDLIKGSVLSCLGKLARFLIWLNPSLQIQFKTPLRFLPCQVPHLELRLVSGSRGVAYVTIEGTRNFTLVYRQQNSWHAIIMLIHTHALNPLWHFRPLQKAKEYTSQANPRFHTNQKKENVIRPPGIYLLATHVRWC
jgi:hypothetical protein